MTKQDKNIIYAIVSIIILLAICKGVDYSVAKAKAKAAIAIKAAHARAEDDSHAHQWGPWGAPQGVGNPIDGWIQWHHCKDTNCDLVELRYVSKVQ